MSLKTSLPAPIPMFFGFFTASTAQAGLQLLELHKDEIGLLMTDERMPASTACGFWNAPARSDPASSASWSRPMRT
jgi:hypothetical protein